MNKRIILVGPTAAGKTFLRNRFEKRGFVCDISYTSRPMREGEVDGVHYNFLGKRQFETLKNGGFFYEWVEYNGYYYGTGLKEWNELPLFIMETDGIKHITPEDRENCFVIYLNPREDIRHNRMKIERNWSTEEIAKRIKTDNKKFSSFTDYDMIIEDPYF